MEISFINFTHLIKIMMSYMEGQSGENVETEVQKYMEALKDYIGKKVKIEYVSNGVPRKEEGTLKNVEEYRNIQIEV